MLFRSNRPERGNVSAEAMSTKATTPIDTAAIRAREAMVFGWAKSIDVPVAWVLAGGYTTNTSMDGLVNLHRLTIEAAVA